MAILPWLPCDWSLLRLFVGTIDLPRSLSSRAAARRGRRCLFGASIHAVFPPFWRATAFFRRFDLNFSSRRRLRKLRVRILIGGGNPSAASLGSWSQRHKVIEEIPSSAQTCGSGTSSSGVVIVRLRSVQRPTEAIHKLLTLSQGFPQQCELKALSRL